MIDGRTNETKSDRGQTNNDYSVIKSMAPYSTFMKFSTVVNFFLCTADFFFQLNISLKINFNSNGYMTIFHTLIEIARVFIISYIFFCHIRLFHNNNFVLVCYDKIFYLFLYKIKKKVYDKMTIIAGGREEEEGEEGSEIQNRQKRKNMGTEKKKKYLSTYYCHINNNVSKNFMY